MNLLQLYFTEKISKNQKHELCLQRLLLLRVQEEESEVESSE